jgi:hypothetical protein
MSRTRRAPQPKPGAPKGQPEWLLRQWHVTRSVSPMLRGNGSDRDNTDSGSRAPAAAHATPLSKSGHGNSARELKSSRRRVRR